MIVIGAKGHAKEVLQILIQESGFEPLFFFDNVTVPVESHLYDKFKILHSFDEVKNELNVRPSFISAIANPIARQGLVHKFIELGGNYTTVIAKSVQIGNFDVTIGDGSNVMSKVVISNSVSIGSGCLINQNSALHHDVRIGIFCDIGPNALILGRVCIGNHVVIGAGAIILPDVIIEDNVIIGAGSVVTKNVKEGNVVVGNPAKPIKQ